MPFRRRLAAVSFCLVVALALPRCVSGPPADDLSVGGLPDQVSPAAVAIAKLTKDTCGATWSLDKGDRAKSDLYVVSVFQDAGQQMQLNHFPSPQELEHFMLVNRKPLRDRENHVGTFCEHDRGDCRSGSGALNCYIEISIAVPEMARAAELARACNQKSIAFLGKSSLAIIDQHEGKPFGTGSPLSGPALAACAAARGR